MPKFSTSSTISRAVNAVTKRMNDQVLIRRPLPRNRSNALHVRPKSDYAEDSADDDFNDPSPDYEPPTTDDEDDRRSPSPPRTPLRRSERIINSKKRERTPSPPRQPQKKIKVESPKRLPSTAPKSVTPPPPVNENQWGECLPTEILHKIFGYALIDEPTIQFLTKMRLVCRSWNMAASMPHLWSNVDVEFLKHKSELIVFTGLEQYATGIREFSISRWMKLKTLDIKGFLQMTGELRGLDVSFCRSMDLRQLLCHYVPRYCPKLESLDLSYIDPVGQKRIMAVLREYLASEMGPQLVSLILSGNALRDVRRLCAESALNKATENIRVLQLSRVCLASHTSRKIRLVDFVTAFPNLRVLHMADAMLDFICTKQEEEVELKDVWSYLCECNISALSDRYRYYGEMQDVFIRLLGRCKNLRRLDLSGWSIKNRLNWLRETPLTHINLSRVRDLDKDAVTVQFFATWGHSLESLCISWLRGYVKSLCDLFASAKETGMEPKLKRLDLTGTCVTANQLRFLLSVCQSLQYVDAGSCRGMPLGMKRAYNGADEMEALREKLDKVCGKSGQ